MFKGLDKIQILRHVGAQNDVAVDGGENVKEEDEAGKVVEEEDVTVKKEDAKKQETREKEDTVTE